MGMANVYREPIKPKTGLYLERRNTNLLWKVTRISPKTKVVTATQGPDLVMKVKLKNVDKHFVVRNDI